MPVQLNPSKVPIWQSESTLQLGIGESDQRLQLVSSAQERLINLLFQGVAEDQLEVIGESVGLDAEDTNQLVERLRPSLLDKPSHVAANTSLDTRFAELMRIAFETNRATEDVIRNRADTRILIPVLDRTGLTIAKVLAEAGFRNLVTRDYEMVSRNDLGELGYRTNQLGLPRLSAARVLLEAAASTTQIFHENPKDKSQPILVVISDMHRVIPSKYRNESLPHLGIEYGISELRITGIIRFGVTACLGCRELWEMENDENWISNSIQLSARGDFLDDGASLLLASSIAAKTICSYIDGNPAQSVPGFRVNLETRAISEFSWQPHPKCCYKT